MKQGTDFKNDLFFKYLLHDDQDPDCLYLLRLLIKGILHIHPHHIQVMNPELYPKNSKDKNMKLDLTIVDDKGQIINIEMQNSMFNQYHYYRFQGYGAKLLANQIKQGQSYIDTMNPIFQIILIDDIDLRYPKLCDWYTSKNDKNHQERYNLIHRVYVQLPYINVMSETKGIENLTELELLLYIFKNGLSDDIMRIEKEVIKIMERKFKRYNREDILLSDEEMIEFEEWSKALEKGLAMKEKQKELVLKYFHKSYPGCNDDFLQDLTLDEYDLVFDMLLDSKDIESIKKEIL